MKIKKESFEEYFTDQSGRPFVLVKDNDTYQLFEIGREKFKSFLRVRVFEKSSKALTSNQLSPFIDLMKSLAFSGDNKKVFCRVGKNNDDLYYDLKTKNKFIEINSKGWNIVNLEDMYFQENDIYFNTYSNQLEHVFPDKKGDIDKIFEIVNIDKDSDEGLLLITYLITSLIYDIPHPIPIISGNYGTAKSGLTEVLQELIDPVNTVKVTNLDNIKGVIQKISHSWLTIYDNQSSINNKISDVLCTVSTGGSLNKRKLFSDDDDVYYSYKSLVGVNGLKFDNLKVDLLSRALHFNLDAIPAEKRITESRLKNKIKKNNPKIFGGMLDLLVKAMSIKAELNVKNLPRLADFYEWGCAITIAYGKSIEDFENAFYRNNNKANEYIKGLTEFIKVKDEWSGRASDLLNDLKKAINDKVIDISEDDLPGNARWVSKFIDMYEDFINSYGIIVDRSRTANERIISLSME